MRPIDADKLPITETWALVNSVNNSLVNSDNNSPGDISFAPLRCVLMKDIDNALTVEPSEWQFEFFKRMVEKVRPTGKWEEIATNPPFLDHRFYICSECGREIDVIIPDESLDDYPYCHCGARMIKEGENGTDM